MKEQKMKTIAALGVTTLAVGATTTQVQAEEVAPASTPVVTSEATSQTSLVTEQQVKQAEGNLNTANEAVASAQADVTKAESVVTTTQNETNQAQNELVNAQMAADKATPEVITAQETEVQDASNLVSVAESAVAPAQEQFQQAQDKVVEQEGVVKQEEKAVATAQADVNTAQQAVNQAQDVLNGTGQAQAIAEKTAADESKREAEVQVTQAEQAVENAKVTDKALEVDKVKVSEQLATAQTQWNETNEKLVSAKSNLSSVESQKNNAESEVVIAKEVVDRLESNSEVKNTILFPEGYAEALKNYEKTKSTTSRQVLFDLGEQAKVLNGYAKYTEIYDSNPIKVGGYTNYKSSKQDENELVSNGVELTESQRLELTKFTVELVNQFRQVLGMPLVVVNYSAIDFANGVANNSNKDNHDGVVISSEAANRGLNTYGSMDVNYYENLAVSGYFYKSSSLNLNDVKRGIYNSVLNMMFNDEVSNWAHATSLGGVREDKSKYMGVDISYNDRIKNFWGQSTGRIHILGVSEGDVLDANKFNTVANLPISDSQEALTIAKTNLVSKQTRLAELTKQYDVAKALVSVAEANHKQSEQTLIATRSAQESIQNKALQTPQAEQNLKLAQANLVKANERVAVAELALSNLTADVKTKQEAFEKAQANLKAKQEVLAKAQSTLNVEQTDLTRLKEEVAQAEVKLQQAKDGVAKAKTNLKSAQAELDKLKNADKNLQAAKEKLAAKMEALTVAKTTLADKVAILNDLLAKKEISQKEYDALMAKYQVQLEAERLAKLEEKRVALEKQGEEPVAVKDDKGVVVDYTTQKELDAKKAPVQGKQSVIMNKTGLTYAQINPADYQVLVAKVEKAMTGSSAKSAIKQGTEATLPATPSQENLALLAIGVGMTGLGLAGLGKKRRG